MGAVIRSASEGDQAAITKLVRDAHLNPRNLDWKRFVVAEDQGTIVGVRQMRVHKGGTREVASGVVLPAWRRRGISAQLMHALLDSADETLYLMCDQKWLRYYERFGFHRVSPKELPPDFRREYRIGRIVTAVLSVVAFRKLRIVPMRRA